MSNSTQINSLEISPVLVREKSVLKRKSIVHGIALGQGRTKRVDAPVEALGMILRSLIAKRDGRGLIQKTLVLVGQERGIRRKILRRQVLALLLSQALDLNRDQDRVIIQKIGKDRILQGRGLRPAELGRLARSPNLKESFQNSGRKFLKCLEL